MHVNMIFLTFTIYPVSITIFCWSWFCGIYSLMLILLFFKGDVIMTIYVIRINPFDVLFINRIDRMTSTVRSTQLVEESEEKWKKSDPQETRIIIRRKKQ